MGLFSRFKSLVRGFFGSLIGNLESNNPKVLIEDIKLQIDKARKEAEQKILEIMTDAEMLKREISRKESELGAIRKQIERTSDKGTLTELLAEEDEIDNELTQKKADYAEIEKEVESIKEGFRIFEEEMAVKLRELNNMKSYSDVATMRENMASLNAKTSVPGNRVSSINSQMGNVKNIIDRKVARSEAIKTLNGIHGGVPVSQKTLSKERAIKRAEELLAQREGYGAFEVKEKTAAVKVPINR